MLSYVVALGKNNEIGLKGKLPWDIKEDLAYFKKVTTSQKNGNTMIMGRKTFQSLPKILPGRHHIVITNDPTYTYDHKDVTIVTDIKEIYPLQADSAEYFVIGGAEIFKALLPYTDKFYFTFINKTFQADVFYPEIDFSTLKLIEKSELKHDNTEDASFTFETYLTLVN